MLLNLATILSPAVRNRHAVACFNVFGYEDACAVVDAAERLRAPVILAANRDFAEFMPPGLIAAMFRTLAENASVPVCAHLDHAYEVEAVLRAVDAGFTSVMYDGSQLPIDENIAATARVVAYAHAAGCSVEGEIGSVRYAEGRSHIKQELTEPESAARFAKESGVDAVAVSIGNVHRLRQPGATIDFGRFAAIRARVGAPLVIHGTSGIATADIRKLVDGGVAKFNVGTTLRQAFAMGLRATLESYPDRIDRLEIMRAVMPAMTQEAERMMQIFGWRDPGAE